MNSRMFLIRFFQCAYFTICHSCIIHDLSLQFKSIVTGFTKMESLTLSGASNLTVDDLKDCLKDHKILNFLSFGRLLS